MVIFFFFDFLAAACLNGQKLAKKIPLNSAQKIGKKWSKISATIKESTKNRPKSRPKIRSKNSLKNQEVPHRDVVAAYAYKLDLNRGNIDLSEDMPYTKKWTKSQPLQQ